VDGERSPHDFGEIAQAIERLATTFRRSCAARAEEWPQQAATHQPKNHRYSLDPFD